MRKGEAPLDAWTGVHFAAGVVLRQMGLKRQHVLPLLVAYEAFEWMLRSGNEQDGGLLECESPANVIADIGAGWLGYNL